MPSRFDTDIVKTTVFRSVDDAGKAIVDGIRRKKSKTKQDLDTLRNWDRAQKGKRQTRYRYDDKGNRVPYSDPGRRPKYAKDQVDKVWDRSRSQQVADINAGDLDLEMPGPNQMWVKNIDGDMVLVSRTGPGGRPWDMGHIPRQEYRRLHAEYMSGGITKQEFLDRYRDPARYQVEDRGRNQSHQDEAR